MDQVVECSNMAIKSRLLLRRRVR